MYKGDILLYTYDPSHSYNESILTNKAHRDFIKIDHIKPIPR